MNRLIYDVNIQVNGMESVVYFKSATLATGAQLTAALQASHCRLLPVPYSVYNYPQLVVVLNISLFVFITNY